METIRNKLLNELKDYTEVTVNNKIEINKKIFQIN